MPAPPAVLTQPWPLTGRHEDLEAIVGALDAGSPAQVIIGEAGAGKTRLAREVLRRMAATGTPTAGATASESASSTPLGALAHLVPPGSIDSPFGSLVLSLTIAYVWPLFVGIGSAQNQAFGYLGYITPWSYKWWLFSERPWLVAVGALVMLAFTALLVWFGLSRFKKRDL